MTLLNSLLTICFCFFWDGPTWRSLFAGTSPTSLACSGRESRRTNGWLTMCRFESEPCKMTHSPRLRCCFYWLSTQLAHDYVLKAHHNDAGTPSIITPFANDSNLLTRNPRTHKRILNTLHEKLVELYLALKVPKCVSLGLQSGIFTRKEFVINSTRSKRSLVIMG